MAPLQIVYACLPEESPEGSAVHEFATRGRRALETLSPSVSLDPLSEETTPFSKDSIVVFLLSCGADGSVQRSVRKYVKKMKEDPPPAPRHYCLALLGHAVCKASAEQLNEQIFSAGQRLAKTLENCWGSPLVERLETQVELVTPEDAFDPWIEQLMIQIRHQLGDKKINVEDAS